MASPDPDLKERKVQKPKKVNGPFLKSHNDRLKASKKNDDAPKSLDITPYCVAFFKWTVIALLFNFILSRMITESWFWGYSGKWTNRHTYVPRPQKTFTERELLKYRGEEPGTPIYIALDGDVFDVTAGARTYGPGGSYHHFAGRDGARAYVTGCFSSHLTHDIRGLSAKELESLDGWKKFYRNHANYFQVGRVHHNPVNPDSPLPPPCDARKEGGSV